MPHVSPSQTQLTQHLVCLTGRAPEGFEATLLLPDHIRVLGPRAAAVYRIEGWVSTFMRHLHQGYFDEEHQPVLTTAGSSFGGGGTG